MQHDKFRMVLRSTVGAVILMPAIALAQGNTGSPSQGSGSEGSGSEATGAQGSPSPDSRSQHSGAKWSGSEDTTKQGSSKGSQGSSAGTSGSATDPAAGSQSADLSRSQSGSAPSSTSRQSIDPAEVQRVFGTDATVVDLQTLGPEQIRSVQQSLQERGLYKGAIDGVYGPQTRAGLKAMLNQQHSLNQRLINQGQVTGPLAASMGIQQSDIAPVAGSDAPSGQGSGIRSQPSTQGTQPSGMEPSGMQPSGSSTSPTTGSSSGSRSPTGSPSGSGSSGSAGSSGSSPGASGTQYPR